jgi:hypothetical protein
MIIRATDLDPADERPAGRMVVRALGLPAKGTPEAQEASEILQMLGLKPYKAAPRSTQAGAH